MSTSSYRSTDVIVVGGGLAGLAAAATAASLGAETLLLERAPVLGGNAVLANVHTICGLFEDPATGALNWANPGFPKWFTERLLAAGAASAPEVHGRVVVVPTDPPKLAQCAAELVARLPRLRLILNAELIRLDCSRESPGGVHAHYSRHGQVEALSAKVVVDATGDATAAALAQAETDSPGGTALQSATLIFRVSGANPSDLHGYSRLRVTANVARSARTGGLAPGCESILVRPAGEPGEAYISLNLPKPSDGAYDPLDPAFLARYRTEAIHLAEQLIQFLATHVDGWSQCRLREWPVQVGIRESRRLVGRYVMTEDDILQGQGFPDRVARSTWPIEHWQDHRGASFRYPQAAAEVPLRALISRTFPNLGAAGRCMSATPTALAALRVLGTAMATGEAIGVAAAIAADQGAGLDEVTGAAFSLCHQRLQQQPFTVI